MPLAANLVRYSARDLVLLFVTKTVRLPFFERESMSVVFLDMLRQSDAVLTFGLKEFYRLGDVGEDMVP